MKKLNLLTITCLGMLYFQCNSQSTKSITYPTARKTDKVNTYHQTKVADPYQWMEELESEELKKWMLEQENLFNSYLSGSENLVEEIRAEIEEPRKKDIISAPMQSDGTFILPITRANSTGTSYYLLNPDNQEKKLLVDFDKLNDEVNTYSFNRLSPKGKYIAINQSVNKSRYNNVIFYDIEESKFLSDTITGFYGGRSFLAWDQSADGFYYSKYEVPEDPQAPLPMAQFMYHKIGTSQSDDILIFENPSNPGWVYIGSVTYDNQFLILHISTPEQIGNMLYIKDLGKPTSPFVKAVDTFENIFTFLYKNDDRLFFRSTLDAPNHRVVSISTSELTSMKWKEVIPESANAISGTYTIGSTLLLRSNVVTRTVLNAYDLDGNLKFKLEPDGSSIFMSGADRTSTRGYMTTASIVSPAAVYEVDLESGEMELFSKVNISTDPSDFTFEHTSFTSRDGTEIPIQLVYRKDLKKDGSAPVFMYGYGAFNWPAYPWQSYLRPWVQRGGIYVIPNIRGGGVYGADWYKDGSREKKINTINDFIDASEWLVESGYTSKGKIIANGGSASGLLPAIAINERPDLYGACIIDYPVLDMLRYHKFGSANWTSEFGTSDDEEDFELLKSYSPYHNIKENSCYPPTIVQVGELDNTTTPMHGYKYAAALQHAISGSCNNPVLLQIARGAGHSAGATPQDRMQTWAEQLAFLYQVMDIQN